MRLALLVLLAGGLVAARAGSAALTVSAYSAIYLACGIFVLLVAEMLISGAGLAAFFVVLFLSLALWAGLSNVMDAGWAGLIVAAVWAIIGGVLFAVGRQKLREVNPKPERTVDTLSNVPDALKGNHRGGSA